MNIADLRTEDIEAEFNPPSFEPWLGRIHMLRLLASMAGFLFTWLVTYSLGLGWEQATIRGLIAGIVLHFVAWAVSLFIFGELYDIEVRTARTALEQRERERIKKQQQAYRDRLVERGVIDDAGNVVATPEVLESISRMQTESIDEYDEESYAA